MLLYLILKYIVYGTWNMEKKVGKTWKNIYLEKYEKNSKFKTSAPARNDKVESPDELYSASY